MQRPTLAQAINQGIGIPVGVCANDIPGNAAVVNQAQEELMYDPLAPDEGWWGGWVKMVFTVQSTAGSSFLTTPWDIARVILMDVCKTPIQIRNSFYEYLEFGIGEMPKGCNPQRCLPNTTQAFERDSVVTLADFPATPSYLRAYPSNAGDLGKRIVFQGNDQNGLPVLGMDSDTTEASFGETVFLAAPFSRSNNTFTGPLTGILKDPTLGQVQVFAVDPTTGASSLLTTLQPNETTAQYRRYFINGLPCNCCSTPGGLVQVTAQCKLEYVPVVNPSDYLIIPNIPALKAQVQSIRYSRMDSKEAGALEAKHHARAVALLNGQLDHYLGKTRTAIAVPLFGSDRLTPQPI